MWNSLCLHDDSFHPLPVNSCLLILFWTTFHGISSVCSNYEAVEHGHKFSIKFRSGDWMCHFNRLIVFVFFSNHCLIALVKYLELLSCWNTQLNFIFTGLTDVWIFLFILSCYMALFFFQLYVFIQYHRMKNIPIRFHCHFHVSLLFTDLNSSFFFL